MPDEVAVGPHSPAFHDFLWNWFGHPFALTRGEVDITFLKDLTPGELATARDLIRRNLKTRQNHIIKGTAALHDVDAVPLLHSMLEQEPDLSRRLTIAGALWKLTGDPVFPELLYEARKVPHMLVWTHLFQVLWLDGEQALDFLIDMIPRTDRECRFRRPPAWLPFRHLFWQLFYAPSPCADQSPIDALSLLNRLESGLKFMDRAIWNLPSYCRTRQHDPAFRAAMIEAIQRMNQKLKRWG